MEPVWKKALRKAYYKTGDFCNRPVPSVGCERSLAWCAVELYFLWNVLLCSDHAWDCCRTGSRLHFGNMSYQSRDEGLENDSDRKDVGDHCGRRIIFPCKWIEGRMVYVLQYDKAF